MAGTAPMRFHLFRELPEIAATTANEIEVRYWGGAMAEGDAPVGHRDAPCSVTVDGTDEALAGGHRRLVPQLPPGHERTATAYTLANYGGARGQAGVRPGQCSRWATTSLRRRPFAGGVVVRLAPGGRAQDVPAAASQPPQTPAAR